jgi:hypothetical protein
LLQESPTLASMFPKRGRQGATGLVRQETGLVRERLAEG